MQKNQFIQHKNKSIHYRVFGKGSAVVLIHGFGEDGNIWNALIKDLQNDFLLIVPDIPGSGKSEMLEGNISIEDYADVIKEILNIETSKVSPKGVDLEGAVLIGHSMGGYITLAFAKKYPEQLNGFGLFHSSAFADSEEKKEIRKKGIEFIHQHGAFEFLKNSTPNLFSPLSRDEKPELIDGFIRSLSNFSDQSLVNYYEAMMQRPDRTELLKTIALPVLFVMGKYDNAVPLQDGLKQTHMPEKSYIHILHQSGHMGMLEEPDNSNHILKQFLSET